MLRVLVQQEPEIGGRLMGRSDGQEHVLWLGTVASSIPRRVVPSRPGGACLTIPELE